MRRFLFLTAAALFAQDPTFIVDSKLVVINVSVKDKSGKPITNLKKEDFQILEDGVPQTITVFDRQELSSSPLAPLSFAVRPGTIESVLRAAARRSRRETPAARDLSGFRTAG
jgi:VWFA-related protein